MEQIEVKEIETGKIFTVINYEPASNVEDCDYYLLADNNGVMKRVIATAFDIDFVVIF
jgi:hypothetical protein